jgi:hypothetical protein
MSRELEVWRCAPCDTSWVGAEMEPCFSCGGRPTHVKPYRESVIIGSAVWRANKAS